MNNETQEKEKKQRLFFGIAVDPWKTELANIQKDLQPTLQKITKHINWYPSESFHITLVFLGEITPSLKQTIEERVHLQLSVLPMEPIKLKPISVSLLSRRHIIVDIHAPLLSELHEKLRIIAENAGVTELNHHHYKAHLALGKLNDRFVVHQIRETLTEIKLKNLHSLKITEFQLFESKPHRQYCSIENFKINYV